MKKNNMFRKGMILGIIVLFVGASVVPSISGNIKNNSGVKDELNVNVGYQKSVEPDSHMIQLSSRELPDTVYVYNNRSDPFDSNAIGYIWQQLGLLTENGQPGVVQGDNVVDPDNPNTVLGTVIRDGNGQVIGYRSNDGTQEAYVVNEGATTAQAWNRTVIARMIPMGMVQ